MIRVICRDLGRTESYSRREMQAVVGGSWGDGRSATVWLNTHAAKARRRNGRHCKTELSRYAVSRVPVVGFAGVALLWDKEFPEAEHGGSDDGEPSGPYTVMLDPHGRITCTCTAGVCHRDMHTCRHSDASLALIDDGAFDESEDAGC